MGTSKVLRAFLTSVLLASVPLSAAADVPPPDSCQNEGASCENAGPNADARGTCEQATCTRTNPGDGGVMSYDCLRCVASSSGSNGKEDDDDGGCSCRLSGATSERGLVVLMLVAGAGALAWSRRRRT